MVKPQAMSDEAIASGAKPDFQSIAKGLRSAGYSYEDIKKGGSAILNKAPEITIENPEDSRPSDPEAILPEKKEGGTPKAVQELLNAYEGLEAEEATPVQGSVKTQQDEVKFGGTDLNQQPRFKGTDLVRKTPVLVETPSDIKEQVFLSTMFSDLPFSVEDVKAEADRAIQGLSSIRDNVTSSITNILVDNKKSKLMESLGEDTEENAKKIKDFVEIEGLQPETKQVKMQTDFYDSLPDNKSVPTDSMVFLNSQVRTISALSNAASIKLAPESPLEDIGELLIPIFGEVLYIDFQNALSESNYDSAIQLIAGHTQMDNVAKKYWTLDKEGQGEYLANIVTTLQSSVTSGGTNNDLLKIDLATKVIEKLLEGPSAVDEFTFNDAMNFTENFIAELAVVAPVLKIVKDGLKMRKISRMRGASYQNTVEALEYKKPKPMEGEFVPKGDPVYPNNGTGTSLDIVISKSPNDFKKLMNDRELKDVTDSMGVMPEDMPRRILPRMADDADNLPQPNGVHHTYLSSSLQRKIDNNHLAQQLQKEEIDGLLPDYVVQVAKDMGETATPHLDKSYFDVDKSAAGSSLGTFVVRLGDSPESGFKTATDARMVASKLYGDNATVVRKTPYGNFSDDLMEGTNAYGDYFVEIRQQQQTTSSAGKGYFLGGEGLVTGGTFKPVLNFVLDDDLLFNDKIQRTYSNIRDRANAFGVDLGNKAVAIAELATRPQDISDFNMLSIKMQDKGIDAVDTIELTALLGRTPSTEVIEALKAARNINSANWYIKNDMEYSALSQDRYKTVLINNERFISKPLLNKPEMKDLKGSSIYDPQSKTDIPLNQNIIDGLYEGGGLIATMYKPVKTADKGEFTQIIVRNPAETVKQLQPDVTPYVKGHVQTSYKDDGFVVVGTVTKTVDGVKRSVPKALGIAATKTEAAKLASALANRGAKLLSKAVVPTGEYTSRMGLKSASNLSLEVSMERGQRLKGFHGEDFGVAEIVDPFSAYIKTMYNTRKKYEQPTQDLMKKRWLDRYKDILVTSKFPVDISDATRSDIFSSVVDNPKLVQEATTFHRRIKLAEGGDLEKASNFVNSYIRKAEMWAGDYTTSKMGSVINPKLEAALKSIDVTKAQALGSGLANVRFIWGNPLFQVLGPLAQSPFLLSQGPMVVAKSLGELVYNFIPLALSKETDNFKTWGKVLSHEQGIKAERLNHEFQTIVESGIVRTVGLGQDYQTDMSLLLQALMENKTTRGITVGAGKALKIPIKAMKGSVLGAMDIYELLSFFVAKNKFVKNNKGLDWTLPENMKEISYEARGLSFNQNDTGRLAYQNADNPLKFSMAMMSYVNRLFVRQYLDPMTGGLLSKMARPKGSRGVNPYANTVGAAIGTTLVGAAMFGEQYFDPLDLDFGESQKEYLKSIADRRFDKMLDSDAKKFFSSQGIENPTNLMAEMYYMGLHTATTNMMFDGDSDFSEKFNNNSYVKAMYDKVVGISTGNAMDSVFGLPYVAGAGLVNVTVDNAKMLLSMEDLESRDVIFAGLEFASQLKIVDDSVAAYYAINLGRRVTKSTLSPQDKSTMYEQLSRIAGGVPYSEMYSMRNFDMSDLPRTSSDNFQNYMIRKLQFDVYNAFLDKGENLSEEEVSDIVTRNYVGMVMGESDLLTDEAKKKFRSRITEVGEPIEIGGLTINREIQEQGINQLMLALQDETPSEKREKVKERLGLIELQIKANPNEVSLKTERDVLQSFLRNFYDKTAEELNDEYLEEATK